MLRLNEMAKFSDEGVETLLDDSSNINERSVKVNGSSRSWGWYFAHIQWPSLVVLSLVLAIVYFARDTDPGDWTYTKFNEWSYSFKEQKDETVPAWGLGLFAMLDAVFIIIIHLYIVRHGQRCYRIVNLANVVCGMFESFILATLVTEAAKYWISEPRPDFRWRCLGCINCNATYTADGTIICTTGDNAAISEGRLSFPSGHSSMSGAIGVFTSAYLIWLVFMRSTNLPWRVGQKYRSLKAMYFAQMMFPICLLPWGTHLYIAASRVRDHWHSPADVAAGALIGSVSAIYVLIRVVASMHDARIE